MFSKTSVAQLFKKSSLSFSPGPSDVSIPKKIRIGRKIVGMKRLDSAGVRLFDMARNCVKILLAGWSASQDRRVKIVVIWVSIGVTRSSNNDIWRFNASDAWTIRFRCNPFMRNAGLPSSVPEVSGNSTTMRSRKNASTCECIALMSTIAAANCLNCESSNSAISAVAVSELLVGVDIRLGVPAYMGQAYSTDHSLLKPHKGKPYRPQQLESPLLPSTSCRTQVNSPPTKSCTDSGSVMWISRTDD